MSEGHEMQDQDTKEQLKKDILDILAYCINCRFCLPSCPRFDITTGDISQGASGITRALYYAIKWRVTDKGILTELRDVLYSCMTCKNCEIACKNLSTGTKLIDAIERGRELLIEEMIGPMPEQKRALESLYNYGNPYGMSSLKRKSWLKGLNVTSFSKEVEVLFYVGCTAPNDFNVQNIAKGLVQLLEKAQIRFGILEDEICCGYPSLKMGERGLFEEICEKNLKQFKSLGVKRMVTLSPHCFDTFLSRYPQEAMKEIKVQHYSQFLADLINEKRIVFQKNTAKKVMYQDSCYLGRYNNIYDEPRRILKSIPGLELLEFRKCKADSLCCGGGGGRMWADFDTEVDRLAHMRVKEACEMGTEIIVTACPWCLINMVDGVKLANVEDSMKIRDLAEFCADAL
jgi:Fe-S oxidoreductase